MKKSTLATLAAGATLALGSAHAATGNPFEATRLDAGYQLAQADKKSDASCGGKKADAKCGADKKAADMKGSGMKDGMKDKKMDASCGGKKGEASCGAKK